MSQIAHRKIGFSLRDLCAYDVSLMKNLRQISLLHAKTFCFLFASNFSNKKLMLKKSFSLISEDKPFYDKFSPCRL